MDKYLWVFIGGGLGSILRFALSNVLPLPTGGGFPWPTFWANVLATLILAIVMGIGWTQLSQERGYLLVAVGLCGGFSTFSTFSKEVAILFSNGHTAMALIYALSSTAVCCVIYLLLYLYLSGLKDG